MNAELSKTVFTQTTPRISLCGSQGIQIAGRTFVPNQDTAYVDFSLSFAFPAKTKYGTAIHPQVVANSFQTLQDKVFNLAHLMRKYNPQQNPRDRILGLVVAVEFPTPPAVCSCGNSFDYAAQSEVSAGLVKCPACGLELTQDCCVWRVQADPAAAPGIRAVAAMVKSAEGVDDILASWGRGETPFGGEWTVSMENKHHVSTSGFAVLGTKGIESFVKTTPPDMLAIGYTYVPAVSAPIELLRCLNNEQDNQNDGIDSTRIMRQFNGQDVTFLCEGLDGVIRYSGVGLAPNGMEESARVSQMLASGEYLDVGAFLLPLHDLADAFLKK